MTFIRNSKSAILNSQFSIRLFSIRLFSILNSPFGDSQFGYSVIRKARQGFTMVELMVVIGMIAILMGTMGVSTLQARRRAMVAKATKEAKEMTNAILAFEPYAVGKTLEQYAKGSWQDCTESSMAMILGKVTGDNGEQVPILYNAKIRGGNLVDPWGRPYQYMIEKCTGWEETDVPDLLTAPVLPNYFRLSDKERR